MQKKNEGYIGKLLGFCKIDKCKNCDCLQDELKRLLNEIENEKFNKILKEHIVSKTHPCLGCEPCRPALLIGEFLSE